MKKWNTSITFESHEEVVGVLSALEKYKGEYIPDGVEELIGLLDTMNQEWSRMEEELLRERLANDEWFGDMKITCGKQKKRKDWL